ncbi:MAG: efflux RND transporter permease subunit [candidate division KSB1 bacterium]|nr:efflux RND transporter permease subunit [candidate division KSB1 bacterium]MDZ7303248.1 efflux RND transporter permease subunit [candidate division KSB1 bacterium]MDZ7312140.1 efflux RND transporter permease subunit [candidate division KSB1 bacterium]
MTSFSLKRPVTILMIAIGLCLLGVISWQRLPVQLLPQFILPEVWVAAGMPGASPEKIEAELVFPIEAELATLEGVHDIESNVFADYATTKVSFNFGTDMKFALLKLQQKMNGLENRLPLGTRIEVNRFDTADLSTYLMELSIRGARDAKASLDELRETAERRVRPKLEQVDGVVNVNIGGGQRSTIGIKIDEERCEALNIPVMLVQQKINAFHRQPEHLGRVISAGQILDVNLLGRVDDLSELRELIIDPRAPVRLADVAQVGYSQAERTQLYRVNGKAGVGIFVQKDNTSNMLQVANDVLAQIEKLNKELAPQGFELAVNFSQAALIQQAIDRVENLAITGALLALLVLYLFLRKVRFVLILMIAIPVSLLVTFNLMYGFNLSVNILSLCGLALAIGMLVDNGIVVMENVYAHYQRGESARQAALTGTREVSRSILAATGTTVLVFLPVLFIESEARLFVRELALSVIFPLLVSLVVAVTLIPLLASHALKGKPLRPFGSGRILEIYRLLLKSCIRHRIRTIATVVVFLLISLFIGVVYILGTAAAPPPDRLDVYLNLPRGATLDATDEVVRRLESQILELPNLKEARASVRPEEAHIAVSFVEPAKRTEELKLDKIKEKLRKQNERLEHVDLSFDQPRQRQTMSQGDEVAAFLGMENALRVRGYDLQGLRLLSEQIVQTLRAMPDIEKQAVRSELREGAPELQIRGDRLRLALWGLSMQQVMNAIWATRAEGATTGTPFYANGNEIDVQLQLKDVEQRQLEDVQNMKITNAAGQPIPLREVADIRIDEGPGNIVRYNQERQVKITYDFVAEAKNSKSRLELAEAQIDRMLREMRLPRGFTIEKVEPENKQTVYYWMLGIGAILIYMLLAAQFQSFSSPLVILGTVPTAIIGALFALALSGTPLSLGEGAPMALLGFIVLLGIVVNNGIFLLDRIAILRNERGYRWQRAVMIAVQSRVRPILMTSGTTILGVFPLALKQGTELELWPPFAITVLGGLAVSTVSTLVFIPVLYVGLEQIKEWLKKMGWPAVIAGTLVAAAVVFWFHKNYQSTLYTCLVSLPVWFSILGLIYGMQQFFAIRREKARVAEEKLHIRIKNLTKIYGAPGRFMREWNKQQRRLENRLMMNSDGRSHQAESSKSAEAAFGPLPSLSDGIHSVAHSTANLPWNKENIRESAIWMAAIGALLIYLHTFFTNGFWLTILSLLTLAWLFGARELWYRWRFVIGKPPQFHRKNRKWKFWSKKKNSPVRDESVTFLNFPRRGGAWLVLLFLVYLQLRINSPALTTAATLVILLLYQLRRIAQKIENGIINPELPTGKLRKVKRVIYTIVRAIPFIRPPRPQVRALHGVNLEIGQGMFGLLGPNGAGKTTLMRIIVGVLEPDRGSIKINDRKLAEHREAFHGAIGYLPQDFGLYENMTPVEYLNYHALTNGIYEPERRKELIENLLQSVGLWERRDDKIKTFSGGMKQRVGIAQTLLHLPQIIVVDEPTAGLDPRERIRFRNLLAELAKERIVIFSTHIVEDISSTCHDLAVLDEGRVVYRGSPEAMQKQAQGKVFEAVVPEDEFSNWRESLQIVQHNKVDGGIRLRFLSETAVADLEAEMVEPTLEDAYVYLLR